MRQAYQIRLNDLGDHGARMCQVASDSLRDATKALLTADLVLAEKVIATDVQLDEMRASAEAVAFEILALQAPVASDLRTVVSALWIVADLQRMGALAMHVAKAARRRHPAQVIPAEVRPIFERMGRVGVHLADQAGRVLLERDIELAKVMETEDDLMDDLHQEMFAALLSPGLVARRRTRCRSVPPRPVLRALRRPRRRRRPPGGLPRHRRERRRRHHRRRVRRARTLT